ncbi:MAG: glycosyltransferase [Bacteroidota bacterium]
MFLNNATRFIFLMVWIYLFSVILLISYAGLLIAFLRGWNRLPEINTRHKNISRVFVSVVIPFRNEERNLRPLIESISRQRFSFHHLEVVMVDDHSLDNGVELLSELQKRFHWLKIEKSTGQGKKSALREGISAATGELIVTTDADCYFGRDWLQTISETYLRDNPDMIIMPVAMERGKGFWGAFQQNDYLALQMVTAGAAGCGMPVIGSGANLAFKKKSYLETVRKLPGGKYLSGDDVFLLHAFKAEGFKVSYLKSAQAMVKTQPAAHLRDFLLQRMRWGGKSKGYTDVYAKLTALLILLINSWLVILPLFAFVEVNVLWIWMSAFLLKMIIDRMVIVRGKGFFSVSSKTSGFLLFSLLYPFYILVAGSGSLILKERWKDRKGK